MALPEWIIHLTVLSILAAAAGWILFGVF